LVRFTLSKERITKSIQPIVALRGYIGCPPKLLVLDFNHKLVIAMGKKDEEDAIHVMTRLLAHGEKILKEIITG